MKKGEKPVLKRKMKYLLMIVAATVSATGVLSACTNMAALQNSTPSIVLTNASFGTSSAVYTHEMQNVNITASTSTNTQTPGLLLSLSIKTGSSSLTQFCTLGQGALPCACMISWKEINTVSGGNITVDRTKKLSLTAVQGTLVQCAMEQSFWNEIPAGTVMRMNIVGVSPNTSGINVKDIGYKKGTSVASTGDFVDDTLTPFRNVLRYTCYSKRTASAEVLNETFTATPQSDGNTTPPTVNLFKASVFCVSGMQNCGSVRTENSAQSYYRNLYVRTDTAGQIVSSNSRYECPQVFEKITTKATTPPTASATEPYNFWPMDSMFSVSLTSSTEWSVPITAGSYLMKNGEPSDTMSPADRLQEVNNSSSGGNSGIVWKILGFGKPPNADGTCGHIVDSTGKIRPLTRLRRYRVIYPPIFQDNGQPLNERLEGDQILVPDRLVVDTAGKLTGNMIYGPKPCNFAWFDHEGVTNRNGTAALNYKTSVIDGMPGYVSTSKYYLDLGGGLSIPVNPDGRILPNFDRASAIGALDGPSCSAAIPVLDYANGVPSRVRLVTSYFDRTDKITMGSRDIYLAEIHLNPIDRWSPEYVEDVSFQACVPASDPYVEPPMHFYRDAANQVAWCAKVYPTQNSYWEFLNAKKKFTGSTDMANRVVNWGTNAGATNTAGVKWYTSHQDSGLGLDQLTVDAAGAVKANGCTSTDAAKVCQISLGSSLDYNNCVDFLKNKLTAENALNNRCDRTVKYDPLNVTARAYPLLSSDTDIRDVLKSDMAKNKKYGCMYSVHSDQSKVGVEQPMSNCCGIKYGRKILDPGGAAPLRLQVDTPANEGHLEPYADPAFPNARFCGNPVE